MEKKKESNDRCVNTFSQCLTLLQRYLGKRCGFWSCKTMQQRTLAVQGHQAFALSKNPENVFLSTCPLASRTTCPCENNLPHPFNVAL